MRVFEIVLLIGLILCAIACNFTKKLLPAVVVFMSYSTIMSIIWMILQSPDLAITEAAVGAGVGCCALLHGVFPTQGSNPDLLHCRQTLYCLSYQ